MSLLEKGLWTVNLSYKPDKSESFRVWFCVCPCTHKCVCVYCVCMHVIFYRCVFTYDFWIVFSVMNSLPYSSSTLPSSPHSNLYNYICTIISLCPLYIHFIFFPSLMDRQAIGPRGEPINITLLNEYSTKLFINDLYSQLSSKSFYPSRWWFTQRTITGQ